MIMGRQMKVAMYLHSIGNEGLAMKSGEWLYVRIGGFGIGCDSSLAGYAFLKG